MSFANGPTLQSPSACSSEMSIYTPRLFRSRTRSRCRHYEKTHFELVSKPSSTMPYYSSKPPAPIGMGRDGRRSAWERPMVVRWLVVVVLVVLGAVVGGAPLPPPPPGGVAGPDGYGKCSPVRWTFILRRGTDSGYLGGHASLLTRRGAKSSASKSSPRTASAIPRASGFNTPSSHPSSVGRVELDPIRQRRSSYHACRPCNHLQQAGPPSFPWQHPSSSPAP